MPTSLDHLKQTGTVIVTDTGEYEGKCNATEQTIDVFKPQDATTNPSLLLAAADKPEYKRLIDAALKYGKEKARTPDEQATAAMDRLLVEFGKEILHIIPGRVSTEIDARLSFDKEGTIKKARQLIALYESLGVTRERVLIKIASTWEGIHAAQELEQEDGIHCNLTLLFGFAQAVACAEAGVTLISPFVGRILDWYKRKTGKEYAADEDPGVQSVKKIFTYYKQHGYPTIVMGASFRTVDEIKALAGVDFLTISPSLLEKILESDEPVPQMLDSVAAAKSEAIPKISYLNSESEFRWALLQDCMATDNLNDGIRKFAEAGDELKNRLLQKLSTM